MKYKILLLAFSAAILTSCSTYKAGQTPDDVYYSPAREVSARQEVRVERGDRYEDYVSSQDDRYLRQKIQNREKWSTIDDYSYWYDSRYNYYNDFSYHNYNSWNQPYRYSPWGYNQLYSPWSYNSWSYNPWNTGYYGYGGYYSPAYPVVYYKNPKVYTGTTGKSNLTTFHNRNYSNQNNQRVYSNSNSKGRAADNSNFGSLMKRVFTQPANSNSNSQPSAGWDRPVRTIEPTSTPSSSAGGRSGGYNSSGSSSNTGRGPR